MTFRSAIRHAEYVAPTTIVWDAVVAEPPPAGTGRFMAPEEKVVVVPVAQTLASVVTVYVSETPLTVTVQSTAVELEADDVTFTVMVPLAAMATVDGPTYPPPSTLKVQPAPVKVAVEPKVMPVSVTVLLVYGVESGALITSVKVNCAGCELPVVTV